MMASGSNTIQVVTGIKLIRGYFTRPRSIGAPSILDCEDAPTDCCGSGSGEPSGDPSGDPPNPVYIECINRFLPDTLYITAIPKYLEFSDQCYEIFSNTRLALVWNPESKQYEGTFNSGTCYWNVHLVVCDTPYISGFYSAFIGGGDNIGCSSGDEGCAYCILAGDGWTFDPVYLPFSTGCDVFNWLVTE